MYTRGPAASSSTTPGRWFGCGCLALPVPLYARTGACSSPITPLSPSDPSHTWLLDCAPSKRLRRQHAQKGPPGAARPGTHLHSGTGALSVLIVYCDPGVLSMPWNATHRVAGVPDFIGGASPQTARLVWPISSLPPRTSCATPSYGTYYFSVCHVPWNRIPMTSATRAPLGRGNQSSDTPFDLFFPPIRRVILPVRPHVGQKRQEGAHCMHLRPPTSPEGPRVVPNPVGCTPRQAVCASSRRCAPPGSCRGGSRRPRPRSASASTTCPQRSGRRSTQCVGRWSSGRSRSSVTWTRGRARRTRSRSSSCATLATRTPSSRSP